MRIGVDLDGVLYNFGDSVNRYLNHIGLGYLWKSGPTPDPFWEFYRDWGWSDSQFVDLCNDGVDAGIIFQGPIREGARAAMMDLRDSNNEIIIITDRQFGSTPEKSHMATRHWLEFHEVPYDRLIFSANKTVVKTDIFVEDKLSNYDALTAAGTECWLINRPWNKEDDDRNRIDSVSEFPTKVLSRLTSSSMV